MFGRSCSLEQATKEKRDSGLTAARGLKRWSPASPNDARVKDESLGNQADAETPASCRLERRLREWDSRLVRVLEPAGREQIRERADPTMKLG